MRRTIVLQNEASAEARAIQVAVMLAADDPQVIRCDVAGLAERENILRAVGGLAVGSVEFMREAFRVAGIAEPFNLSYFDALLPFLGRQVTKRTVAQLNARCFVKPAQTKLFTGFVYDPAAAAESLGEDEHEQLTRLRALPEDTPIWIADEVHFVAEWRYYVSEGRIIGAARYDPDGADDAPEPDRSEVERMIAALALSHPYALDAGVLENGATVAVELNDAWAIGLYGSAMKPAAYLDYLQRRWDDLAAQRPMHGNGQRPGCR